VLLIWAFDRLARSVPHLIQVLDELGHLNIEFVSFREQFDTAGPMGRAILIIIGAIAELEHSLIRERVCAGMRRARIEGRHIDRPRLKVNREAIREDHARGMSLKELAEKYRVSKASICKILKKRRSG